MLIMGSAFVSITIVRAREVTVRAQNCLHQLLQSMLLVAMLFGTLKRTVHNGYTLQLSRSRLKGWSSWKSGEL